LRASSEERSHETLIGHTVAIDRHGQADLEAHAGVAGRYAARRVLGGEQRERFVDSVTKGKNQMPPWGGLLKPEEIEALWLYVIAGERG
jgi:hypothetical protein